MRSLTEDAASPTCAASCACGVRASFCKRSISARSVSSIAAMGALCPGVMEITLCYQTECCSAIGAEPAAFCRSPIACHQDASIPRTPVAANLRATGAGSTERNYHEEARARPCGRRRDCSGLGHVSQRADHPQADRLLRRLDSAAALGLWRRRVRRHRRRSRLLGRLWRRLLLCLSQRADPQHRHREEEATRLRLIASATSTFGGAGRSADAFGLTSIPSRRPATSGPSDRVLHPLPHRQCCASCKRLPAHFQGPARPSSITIQCPCFSKS